MNKKSILIEVKFQSQEEKHRNEDGK